MDQVTLFFLWVGLPNTVSASGTHSIEITMRMCCQGQVLGGLFHKYDPSIWRESTSLLKFHKTTLHRLPAWCRQADFAGHSHWAQDKYRNPYHQLSTVGLWTRIVSLCWVSSVLCADCHVLLLSSSMKHNNNLGESL